MALWAFLISLFYINFAGASLGNSFPSYRSCVEQCSTAICDNGKDGSHYKGYADVSISSKLLWNCKDNCQYECMWDTVELFQDKNWPAPQFHGKWPFVRLLGIQEPASMIFSLLNLGIHVKMVKQFLVETRPSNPMYKIWIFFAMGAINGWFWSALFHTRDIHFTELMDYLSAFGMVLCTAYTIGMRLIFAFKLHIVYSLIYTAACGAYFMNHAVYLSWGVFDYRYNMIANLIGGAMLFINSILFCTFYWKTLSHTKHLAVATALLTCSLYFELSDFPPIYWVLDAHALWHMSTATVTYYYWRFILDDSKYLQKEMTSYF